MLDNLWFSAEQLFWLEELDPAAIVQVRIAGIGESEPDGHGILFDQEVPLGQLAAVRQAYTKCNIWRSWSVYHRIGKHDPIGPVPLFFDIDDESSPPNLDNAYALTAACVDTLESLFAWANSPSNLRIVFSGHKGFHLELKPVTPLDGQALRRKLIQACEAKIPHRFANCFFEHTVLDVLNPIQHSWVRVTGTVNSWRMEEGQIKLNRIIQLSVSEFQQLGCRGVLQRAEEATISYGQGGGRSPLCHFRNAGNNT